jgi:hypothetical protein
MFRTGYDDAYRDFVGIANKLRNDGNISDDTYTTLVAGASIFIVNHRLTDNFNSYIDRRFESHFHTSPSGAREFHF